MTNETQDRIVTLKIKDSEGAAVPIKLDLDKLHGTWIAKLLEYGARRFPNDTHSAAKGDEKVDAIKLMVREMEKGGEAPERVAGSGGSSGDPIKTLALKNAKADLTALFRAVTDATKALDFAKHEKVAPFFKVVEDRATWIDETVEAWMAKQAESGKRDYMADAKATVEMGDKAASELDF